ncbi:MAG: ferredoxin--nitrite reductase [Campylobacterota bacterium]|nr:ferredoxin--nitrite reductase [Campylobacterota bacterium]
MSIIQDAFEARNKKINKIEKLKDIKSMAQAMDDLKSYASQGYEAIKDEDLTYYFKCFGIFDKRKENGENSFMIRVRIPGGQINSKQAKVLGEVSRNYCDNSLDLTTRMQVEIRYIKIENLPTILEKLDSVGISTYQTGIDNLRNILTDPLDGVATDCKIESMPILKELQEVFFKQEEWIGKLPRKFNTAISGSLSNRCNIIGHDCCFYLASKKIGKNDTYGFNVALGGKVGVVASKANVFLKDSDEVVSFFTALIKIFKEYGFRDNRNKNRLHFLIEAIGMEELIKAVKLKANSDFQEAGEEILNNEMFNSTDGFLKQKDNTNAIHSIITAGVFSGTSLIKASQIAENYGSGDIRITYEQNIFILGVSDDKKDKCLDDDFFNIYKNINTPYINNLITCIGSKNCQYGIIETKGISKEICEYLASQTPLSKDEVVRLYWSSCIKGCGLNDLGDIGFQGAKFKDENQNMVLGVNITLGGKMTKETKEGRLLYSKISIPDAKIKIAKLMKIYKNEKLDGESFEAFDDRVLSGLLIEDIQKRLS